MKTIAILLLLLSMTSPTWGAVSAKACLSDGVTPLELADPCIPNVYRDVMVGTKLTVIVSSNVAEEWYGGSLVVKDAEMANRGLLYGRDFDGYGYPGSCLPGAGEDAAVLDTYMYPGPGFEIYGGTNPNASDWFIFDYNALDVGDCKIELYDGFNEEAELIQTLSLNHVLTRDFDGNTRVDFADFAVLALYWQKDNCGSLDDCEGADLDTDGNIDSEDLMLFCEYWLEKTK
jgi:hypothetical protein